jgi:serine/threonine protein kinase
VDELFAGRYRLVRRIARGAMAEVYEAEDTELGRQVALKLLAGDADPLRFEREARTFAALDHPNIVRVFDVGESERGPFIVLELVGGGTLGDLLAGGRPLDDVETARLAAQIAAALAHAHERGVVHRDLKPPNVLLDEEGDARLADFGIAAARETPTLTESGTVLGTASYMAPEQATGDPTTPATDVYAFGVVLFQLLTGRLPFDAENPVAVARQHVEAPPPAVADFRADAPADLAAIAAAALAKDPRARPPDGAALVAALEPDARVAVPEEPTAVIAPTPIRRRYRTPIVAAVIALAVLVAGFAGAMLLSDDPPAARAPTHRSEIGDTTAATSSTTRRTTTEASTTQSTTSAATTATTSTATTEPTTAAGTTTAPTTTEPTTTAGTTTAETTTAETTTAETTTTAPATTEPPQANS